MIVLARALLLAILILAAFAGVADSRRRKGLALWYPMAILYTLVAATIVVFILKVLGVWP